MAAARRHRMPAPETGRPLRCLLIVFLVALTAFAGPLAATARALQNTATGTAAGVDLNTAGATVTLNLTGSAVTTVLAEISPNTVAAASAVNAFTYDVLPTINAGDSGVDQVAVSAPSGYANLAVTAVSVGGTPQSLNCPTPGPGQYCAGVSGQVMTVTFGSKVAVSGTDIRIGFNADAPAGPGSADFTATVDDTATAASPQTATAGNADGDVADADSLTVAVTAVLGLGHCSVTADPSVIVADGVAAATITVTLRDTAGNPLPGKDVGVVSDRGGLDTITTVSGTTDAGGSAVFTIASTSAGLATIRATDITDGIVLSQQPTVSFTQGQVLDLVLTANKDEVQVGGIVTYRAALKNRTASDVIEVRLDNTPPPNFKYLQGSARLNGAPLADPMGNRPLTFDIGTVPALVDANGNGQADPGEEGYVEILFQLVVGSGAAPGEYVDRAVARDVCPACFISNSDEAEVTVTVDPLFDLGTIIGKVFFDENRDGWQDEGEDGVAGVMVALDDGTYALTDAYGRYHFPAVQPGHRLIKVNLRSLADGAVATTSETVVVDVTPGLMAKANFGVLYQPDTVKIGRPAQAGVEIDARAAGQPINVVGNTEDLSVLINGTRASLPGQEIRLKTESLEEVIEFLGNQPQKPVTFRVAIDTAAPVAKWHLYIMDGAGKGVRELSGDGAPPEAIRWDGLTQAGEPVHGGEIYQYQMTCAYADGSRSTSARKLFGVNQTTALAVTLTGGAFEVGSARLTPAAQKILQEVAQVLRRYPKEKIVIEGHTDSTGSDESNLDLSKRRATAAADYLTQAEKVSEKRIVVRWRGESEPLASNATTEGRELNRRIEINGNVERVTRSKLLDQYRSRPVVKINGSETAVDRHGRFTAELPDAALKSFTVEVVNRQGQSTQATFAVPGIEILKPADRILLPFGASGPEYRVAEAPETANPTDAAPLVTYPLQGRTEPGNTLEIDGEPLIVSVDGRFQTSLVLRSGANCYGLLVRNSDGISRIINLTVTVEDHDPQGRLLIVSDPVPNLTVQLPPRGVPLTSPLLPVSGKTDPGNRVFINDAPVDLNAAGDFTTMITLPKGVSTLSIRVVDPAGHRGAVDRKVEVTDTQIFMLAFADGKVGWLKNKGFIEGSGKEDGFYTEGRMAFYLKGVIKGRYLVTAAMDTGRSEFEDLFKDLDNDQTRRLLTNLDPDKIYPVYGDGSTVVYDTDSQAKFYLAVDSDTLQAVVGNYQADLTDTELARYQRTLFGLNAHYQSAARTPFGDPNTQITVFGAQVRQRHVSDQLRATGGSLYYLSHKEVIEGSEQVTLEVRDKNTGLVLSRIPQQPNADYSIKYPEGRILFNRPISSVSAADTIIDRNLLPGNPVFVLVEYEAQADSLEKTAFGGRIRQQIGDHVAVGGTFVRDELETESYTLQSVDAEVRLTQNTRIIGEYAQSEGSSTQVFTSQDGGLSFTEDISAGVQDGRAYKLAAEMDVGEWFRRPDRYRIGAYVKRLESGFFSSGNFLESGTTKTGLNLSFKLSAADELRGKLENVESEDSETVSGGRETLGTVQWLHDHGWWGLTVEYQDRRSGQEPTAPSDEDGSLAAARLRVNATDDLTVSLAHQQSVSGPDNNQSTLGARYQVNAKLAVEAQGTTGSEGQSALGGAVWKTDDQELYVSQRLADHRPGQSRTTVIGSRAAVDPTTQVYTEYQWEKAAETDRNVSVMGIQRRWDAAEGLKLMLSGEYGTTHTDAQDGDRYTVAGGAAYTHPAGVKAAARQEVRVEDGVEKTIQLLSSNTLELKLNPDFTLLGKLRFSNTRNADRDETIAGFEEYTLGLAYRPTASDRFNALAKYTWLSDEGPQRPDDPFATDTRTQVASVEWLFDVTRSLEWTEKLAFKMQSETVGDLPQQDTRTLLSINRLNWKFWPRFSLGLEYRILTQMEADDRRQGWLTELMWEPVKHFRIGAGYNFTDFSDNAFAENDYSYQGWFMRFQAIY